MPSLMVVERRHSLTRTRARMVARGRNFAGCSWQLMGGGILLPNGEPGGYLKVGPRLTRPTTGNVAKSTREQWQRVIGVCDRLDCPADCPSGMPVSS